MARISLVIVIDLFSYFVHANLQNVFDTCGTPDDIDFVFLTPCVVHSEIERAFQEASKNHKFRVINTPFQPGPNHLRLLDWAIRHADLTDWVIVQHCDLFWQEPGWLSIILRELNDRLALLCVPCPSSYFIRPMLDAQGTNINITGDFFGVYNRRYLIDHKLFFQCGTLGTYVGVSHEVAEAVRGGLIYRSDNNTIQFGQEYMDGSQAMAWELAVHDPDAVKQIDVKGLLHLTGFFRIAETIRREGRTLHIDFMLGMCNYAFYSYLTSFCIERSEVEQVVLPWRSFIVIAQQKGFDIRNCLRTGIWLRKYSRAQNVIGMNSTGVKQVILHRQTFSTFIVKIL